MTDSEPAGDRPLFIVNPASGGGRTRQRIDPMRAGIERAGLVFDHVLTEGPGHARDLAREAVAAGRTTLIACGGDGTLNEVANGILDCEAAGVVRIGTIGMGTGKDVAKCLGIGRGATAIRAIATGTERPVDVGRVESRDAEGNTQVRHFLLEASAGWVPEISQSVPRRLKRLGDTAPYLIMVAVKMLGPLGREFTVSVDGTSYDGIYNTISVHNMELWGGDMTVAPGAAWDDGLLDIIRWADMGRRKIIEAVQGQRQGGLHLDMEGVDRHPGKVVELDSPKRSRLDLDGEFGGFLPARITILPGALRFLAPSERAEQHP